MVASSRAKFSLITDGTRTPEKDVRMMPFFGKLALASRFPVASLVTFPAPSLRQKSVRAATVDGLSTYGLV